MILMESESTCDNQSSAEEKKPKEKWENVLEILEDGIALADADIRVINSRLKHCRMMMRILRLIFQIKVYGPDALYPSRCTRSKKKKKSNEQNHSINEWSGINSASESCSEDSIGLWTPDTCDETKSVEKEPGYFPPTVTMERIDFLYAFNLRGNGYIKKNLRLKVTGRIIPLTMDNIELNVDIHSAKKAAVGFTHNWILHFSPLSTAAFEFINKILVYLHPTCEEQLIVLDVSKDMQAINVSQYGWGNFKIRIVYNFINHALNRPVEQLVEMDFVKKHISGFERIAHITVCEIGNDLIEHTRAIDTDEDESFSSPDSKKDKERPANKLRSFEMEEDPLFYFNVKEEEKEDPSFHCNVKKVEEGSSFFSKVKMENKLDSDSDSGLGSSQGSSHSSQESCQSSPSKNITVTSPVAFDKFSPKFNENTSNLTENPSSNNSKNSTPLHSSSDSSGFSQTYFSPKREENESFVTEESFLQNFKSSPTSHPSPESTVLSDNSSLIVDKTLSDDEHERHGQSKLLPLKSSDNLHASRNIFVNCTLSENSVCLKDSNRKDQLDRPQSTSIFSPSTLNGNLQLYSERDPSGKDLSSICPPKDLIDCRPAVKAESVLNGNYPKSMPPLKSEIKNVSVSVNKYCLIGNSENEIKTLKRVRSPENVSKSSSVRAHSAILIKQVSNGKVFKILKSGNTSLLKKKPITTKVVEKHFHHQDDRNLKCELSRKLERVKRTVSRMDFEEALIFCLKTYMIVTEEASNKIYKQLHPYAARSDKQFLSWKFGKQAASQTKHARFIHGILSENCRDTPWTWIQVRQYAKCHGYVPVRKRNGFSNARSYKVKVPQSSLTLPKQLPDISLKEMEYQLERISPGVDIHGDDDSSKKNLPPPANECHTNIYSEITQSYQSFSEDDELCQWIIKSLNKFEVNVHDDCVSKILTSIFKSFGNFILRKSLAAAMMNRKRRSVSK